MNFKKTFIDGLFIINNFNSFDNRGIFVKTFHKKLFKENTIDFEIAESYYSVSKKNVIRGMHFQLPPNDHMKLVYVPYGEIIDVVNQSLSQAEKIRKFILTDEPFTVSNKMFTPTLKVRRSQVFNNYKKQIDKLYN